MIDQVHSAQQQSDTLLRNSKVEESSIQQKLFEKVALALASNSINVQGEGAIALDIDDMGNIMVIGDIKNKDEIAETLNKDEEIKSLLTAGLNDQGEVTSEYSQPVDTVDVSDNAIHAYQRQINNQPSANNDSGNNPDLIDSNSTITNNTESSDRTTNIGVVTESMIEEDISKNSMPTSSIVNGLNDLRQILGISDENKDTEGILATLSERIITQRSEINDLISSILEENKIEIGDDEDFDISLAEDGSISIKSKHDDELSDKRAAEIQDALNAESEDGLELKAKLKSMTLDEMALSELSAKQNLNGSTISDGLAVALIENQLGTSLGNIRNEDGTLSEESDAIKELADNSPNMIATLNSSTEYKSAKIYGNVTLSGEGIKSDLVEDYSRSMKKHVEDNLTHNAVLYNDAGVYNENEIKDLPPGFDEYLGSKNATQEKGRISFDVPPELRIESFEARINEHGEVEVEVAKNGMGQELSAKIRDVAETFFKGEVGDHTEYMATFAKTILEEHEAENADGLEFEHEVKVTYDYQEGLEYEVISPEADEKATNDLNIVEANLSEGINKYLKEEESISTPVEIEVNEDGKLTASTQALTSIEANKVESVLDLINESLDEVDSTVALREEQSKFLEEAGSSKVDDEKEVINKDEAKSDIELLGDKFTQKIASKSNIGVETDSKIEEANKLENLIEGKDSTNSEGGSDKTDTIKITIGEASSDVVSKSLADRIMDKLPDGLQGVFEEALKINDILDTFHNKDSLLKAIA